MGKTSLRKLLIRKIRLHERRRLWNPTLQSLKICPFFNIKHLHGPGIDFAVTKWVPGSDYTRVFKFFGVPQIFPSHIYLFSAAYSQKCAGQKRSGRGVTTSVIVSLVLPFMTSCLQIRPQS